MDKKLVEDINIYHIRIPLKKPYHLSFKSLEEFDMIFVRVISGNLESYGDTIPLHGYSDESFLDVYNCLKRWKQLLLGKDVDHAIQYLAQFQSSSPFATTPLLTALETLIDPININVNISYPLLGTLLSETEQEAIEEIQYLLSEGYKTIKVKVGTDVESDIKKVQFVQKLIEDKAIIRLDANQGYNLGEAKQFTATIDPENIELFEQPFSKNDWNSMEELAKYSKLPLMLDESISSEEDVERVASSRCAQFVKFKLMKAGGINRLKKLITKAQQHGLKVILGNGVAGEIGNLYEILVAHSLLDTSGEMNGFLKLKHTLFDKFIFVENGKAHIQKQFKLSLNDKLWKGLVIKQI